MPPLRESSDEGPPMSEGSSSSEGEGSSQASARGSTTVSDHWWSSESEKDHSFMHQSSSCPSSEEEEPPWVNDDKGLIDPIKSETYYGDSLVNVISVGKGGRRHIRSNAKLIAEQMEVELRNREDLEKQRRKRVVDPSPEKPLKPPYPARRPGPWRFCEIFTWSCMLTLMAGEMGWMSFQPVTFPEWDLRDSKDRGRARDYLRTMDPDFLFIAFPCGPWSRLQKLNAKTPYQCRRLAEKQRESRDLLVFTEELVYYQRDRGRAVGAENPESAASWNQPPLLSAFSGRDMREVTTDMCYHGKQRPDTKEYIQKPTKVKGTPEVCQAVEGRCNKKHKHGTILGKMKLDMGGRQQWVPATVWAGAYTPDFCRKLLQGAGTFLAKQYPEEVYANDSDADDIEEIICDPIPGEDTRDMGPVPKTVDGQMDEDSFTPADQVPEGNWSEQEIPEEVREKILIKVPPAIRREVRKSHFGLGHPNRATFVRMMRLGDGIQAAIEYAKVWKCPICSASAAPSKPLEASTRPRPFGFNKVVCLDLKYLKDHKQNHFVALSMVDAGTAYHIAVLVKNRTPRHIVRRLMDAWIMHYGVPEVFVVDQGGEFEAEFISMCEEYNIDTKVAGSHAPWQHGFPERHGGVLGEMFDKVVYQFGLEGYREVKLGLYICCQAKNATLTRHGLTPEQGVFGRSLRWTDLCNADDEECPLAALGADGEAWKSSQIRAAAKMHLLSRDMSDKVRRAMMRRAPRVLGELIPGTRVYFWSPHPLKGRQRRDPHRWRGPATVIAKQSPGRYYVGWRGRVLLTSKDQLRLATVEEAAAAARVKRDVTMAANDQVDKACHDVTKIQERPRPARPVPVVIKTRTKPKEAPGPKAIKMFPSRRHLSAAADAARKEASARKVALEDRKVQEEAAKALEVAAEPGEASSSSAAPAPSPEETSPSQIPIPGGEEEDRTLRKRLLLDDVPASMKKSKYQDSPKGEKQLALLTLYCSATNQSDGWMCHEELQGVSDLLNRKVAAVRIHAESRRRLYDHKRLKGHQRLSSMMTRTGDLYLKDDTENRTRSKAKAPWKGLTVFYTDHPKNDDPIYVNYMDTPEGLVQLPFSFEELQDVHEIYQSWSAGERSSQETYLLRMKASGKELDPKFFDAEQQAKYEEADRKEWKQWVTTESAAVVPLQEERKIPRYKIFTAPMRYVRTNKAEDPSEVEAKSRLVDPGHLDPQLGLYRTDAPTTTGLAVFLCALIAVCLSLDGWVFDVRTAFLSGGKIEREAYVRAPKEGLPAVEGLDRVRPYALLRLLKTVYGLTDAPRAWYLKARQVLKSIGFVELRCARAVFVLHMGGKLIALLTLHVDDGMLFGDRTCKIFQRVKADIDRNFNIKIWKYLQPGAAVTYLGMQWTKFADRMIIDMDTYLEKIEPVKHVSPKCSDTDKVSEEMSTEFKSVLMKLRWPVSHVIPRFAYAVSSLTQGARDGLTMGTVKSLNRLVKQVQSVVGTPLTKIILRKVDLAKAVVVTPFDASFAKEPGMKSQGGFMNLVTTSECKEDLTPTSIVEFQSGTITRVVKSTMAAESAEMSVAVDRHLYLRLLLQSLLYGEPSDLTEWRYHLKIPGILVTDAKSLYDHLSTTGSIPKERQTLIDLLVTRDLVENGAVELRWVPTTHMPADMLTKEMVPSDPIKRLLAEGVFSVKPTAAEAEGEAHRKALRQGQRKRRKERKEELRIQGRPSPART